MDEFVKGILVTLSGWVSLGLAVGTLVLCGYSSCKKFNILKLIGIFLSGAFLAYIAFYPEKMVEIGEVIFETIFHDTELAKEEIKKNG